VTEAHGRSRAAALPTEERRSAIVEAALPLFLDQGAALTTREVAHAAGIAEGTIFRVFPDKSSLLDAVVTAALDPRPTDAAIARIEPGLPFEARLTAAVDILRQRVLHVFRVYSAASGTPRGSAEPRPHNELPALEAIFETEAEHLTRAPAEAARILRGLTLACVHPSFSADEPLSSQAIVAVLLDGVRRPDGGEALC
jgi:AcrR family transcriptional regulator